MDLLTVSLHGIYSASMILYQHLPTSVNLYQPLLTSANFSQPGSTQTHLGMTNCNHGHPIIIIHIDEQKKKIIACNFSDIDIKPNIIGSD